MAASKQNTVADAFDELTLEEQILCLQDLWDRISTEPDAVVVTKAQRDELDRRLARHADHPEETVEWGALRRSWREAE